MKNKTKLFTTPFDDYSVGFLQALSKVPLSLYCLALNKLRDGRASNQLEQRFGRGPLSSQLRDLSSADQLIWLLQVEQPDRARHHFHFPSSVL